MYPSSISVLIAALVLLSYLIHPYALPQFDGHPLDVEVVPTKAEPQTATLIEPGTGTEQGWPPTLSLGSAFALAPSLTEPEGTIVSPQFVGCTSAERFERMFDNSTGDNNGDITHQRNQKACTSFELFSHYIFDRCYTAITSTPPATVDSFLAFDHTACETGCYYTVPRGGYNVIGVRPFLNTGDGFTYVNSSCYTGDPSDSRGQRRVDCDVTSTYRYVRKVRRGHHDNDECDK
ncbi:hypothetical protein IAT40_005375 [Kwoniella sp. CBS 6097]